MPHSRLTKNGRTSEVIDDFHERRNKLAMWSDQGRSYRYTMRASHRFVKSYGND
jgi:hypothetical protein